MISGRELYAFNRAMGALVPHEDSVATYESALAEWDASPELRAMGADAETPGTWGWWTARLVSPPRCATCRWAKASAAAGHAALFPLECSRAEGETDDPKVPETLAFADDDEDYRAWLRVKPSFGCVMWEAKPA